MTSGSARYTNYFDLELKQYDIPTAFLNAEIDRKLYAETPEAFRHVKGEIMLLLRGLYGLKEAPILWYNELRRQLIKLGLKPVEGFPCLYTSLVSTCIRRRLGDLCWWQAIEILVQGEQLSPLRHRRIAVRPLQVFVKAVDSATMLAAHKHPVRSKVGKYTLFPNCKSWQEKHSRGKDLG
jgi:hypothetical protein